MSILSKFSVILATLLCPLTVCGAEPEPQRPWLVFDYSLGMGMGTGYKNVGGARFEVQISDGGPFTRLWSAEYDRVNRWSPYAIDLSKYRGKNVKIRLLTEQIENRICQDMPFWGNPRIVTGNPLAKTPPKEILNLAMTPPERAGGLLADGTFVPLDEKAQSFGYEGGVTLVTPGMVNRKHSILVYGGDKYITVGGKSQPGLYIGYDMSWDYEKYGGGAGDKPYVGPLPPPVFAEWEVDVPNVEESTQAEAEAPQLPASPILPTEPLVLSSKEDVYRYQAGLTAKANRDDLSLQAGMGGAPLGWAFAGLEMLGASQLDLDVQSGGPFASKAPNDFAGLVVDYHTINGYTKRVLFGLGAGNAARTDLRPGGWFLDEASFSLAQRIAWTQEFVDLGAHPNGTMSLDLKKYAPADWDGRIWFAVGLQNQPADATLAARITNVRPRVASKPIADLDALKSRSADFAVLEDSECLLAISKTSGSVAGLWRKRDKTRLLGPCTDTYRMESRTVVTRFDEGGDHVRSCDLINTPSGPALVVICSTPAVPGLLITKTYRFDAGLTSKRVDFSTTDPEGFFITWEQNSSLDPAFQSESRFGGGFAASKRVAQGRVVEADDAAPAEQADIKSPAMQIRKDFSLGLAAYRFRVNDRYVLPSPVVTKPTGWNLPIFTSYVREASPVSAVARWFVFEGDFIKVIDHYASLPEYQAIWTLRQPAAWGNDLLLDTTWHTAEDVALARSVAPAPVSSTLWFLNLPWGDWGPDHAAAKANHPDVYNIAPSLRQAAPNLRLSTYHNFIFDEDSDIFRDSPEVGVRDREGILVSTGISSDRTKGPSYYFQMGSPEVRRLIVDLHRRKMRDWKLDFLYFDGPGFGAEVIDWGTKNVAQSYDYLDYLRATYLAMREVNPDSLIMCNGVLPYSQVGYIEFRHEQWNDLSGPNWRTLAYQFLYRKLTEAEPYTTIPIFAFIEDQATALAYINLYGWAGNFGGGIPWKQSARDFRGMKLVPEAVAPAWWRTGDNFEAYGFTQDQRAVITVLNHEPEEREIEITVDPTKLGFAVGDRLDATLRLMLPPTRQVAGTVKRDFTGGKEIPNYEYNEGPAFEESVLFQGQVCTGPIQVKVKARPMLVSSVILTSAGPSDSTEKATSH